jgi:hypothetical protein
MEAYIRVEETVLTPGYVITTIGDDDVVVDDNCIGINIAMWESCPSKNELRNTLTKRLESKRRGNVAQLSAIAACILCSHDYIVNHVSMSGVTESDIKTVWGFIETSMISSSDTLSSWMSIAVNGRSQDGYCTSIDNVNTNTNVTYNTERQRKTSTILKPTGKTLHVNANVAALDYGSGPTITDLAIADSIMLQRLRFKQGLSPPRNIGPTWRNEDRRDSSDE